MPGDHRHWPARRGQNDGPSAVGSGRTRDGVLDLPGRLQQSVRRLLVLCRRGVGRSGVALPKVLSGCFAPCGWQDHTSGAARRRLLSAQNPPVSLVVDHLHVLTEPTVLTELDFVLRNAQPGLRLVVSSRVDPLLPLHRYRLAGELAEIRASDLAFSTAEARTAAGPAQQRAIGRLPRAPHPADRGLGGPPPPAPRSPWTVIPTRTSSSRS